MGLFFFIVSCSSSNESTQLFDKDTVKPGDSSSSDDSNTNDNVEIKGNQERLLRFVMD